MSQRYVVDSIRWPADSALARMHFAPEHLEHFELAFENRSFRVFRVLDEGKKPRHKIARRPSPLWKIGRAHV